MVAPAEITTVVRLLCTGSEIEMPPHYYFLKPEDVGATFAKRLSEATEWLASSIQGALENGTFSPERLPVIEIDSPACRFSIDVLFDALRELDADLKACGWKAQARTLHVARLGVKRLEVSLTPIPPLARETPT